MRGDAILRAVKRALRRTGAAAQLGARAGAVLIQGQHSRALWAGWRRVRRQGSSESVGVRSLTKTTRRATGSATAMITCDSPWIHCLQRSNLYS